MGGGGWGRGPTGSHLAKLLHVSTHRPWTDRHPPCHPPTSQTSPDYVTSRCAHPPIVDRAHSNARTEQTSIMDSTSAQNPDPVAPQPWNLVSKRV